MTKNLPKKQKHNDLIKDIKEHEKFVELWEENKRNEYLTKGKYDIDYAIGICKMVVEHCNQYKFKTSADLSISLKYSLDKLIKFLQSEKQPRSKDPIILWTCPKCKESETIFASTGKDKICNYCKFGKDAEFTGVEKL